MDENERSSFLQASLDALDTRRERVWEAHRKGAGGIEVVRALTETVDARVKAAYDWFAQRHGGDPVTGRIALVGLGGYGRGELNPHSDIDLMFLVDGPIDEVHQDFVSDMIAFLWDMRFHVGHSCRQIPDCSQFMERDVVTATALLEARFLTGHRPVFDVFQRDVLAAYVGTHRDEFVRRKIAKILERHRDHDNSRFQLEPNVKEGVGGLRDVHGGLWIERVARGIQTLGDLSPSNLLDQYDIVALKAAFDFLLRIRTELHLLAGRKQDVIDMTYQQQVAERFGFRDTPKKAAAENFMSYYYLNVGHICHFLDMILEREQPPEAEPVSTPTRRPGTLPEPFVVRGDRIRVRDDREAYFAGEDGVRQLMRIYQGAQECRLDLGGQLQRCIRRSIPLVRLPLLYLEEIHQQFWKLLSHDGPVAHTLRLMHETGFLGAILPEFEGTTCLYQYDYYHQFTVDEHTLRVLEEAERLLETEDPDLLSIRSACDQIQQPEVLRLAILLHDAGKAEGRAEHTRNGVLLAERVCDRLRAPPHVTRAVKFLVENHLIMSQMAHRRDLTDPNIISHFNGIVASPDILHILYVLTCADIRGVGRGAWTGWKGALLQDLYIRSLEAFRHGHATAACSASDLLDAIRHGLPEGFETAKVETHLTGMPEHYIRDTDPREIAEHILLLEGLVGQLFVTAMGRRTQFTEFIIATQDRPGLFADITGAISGAGFDIWGARVFTRADGVALDVFLLQDPSEPSVPPEDIRRLNQNLDAVFSGRKKAEDLVRAQARRIVARKRSGLVRPSRVQIDNESSVSYTILDVYAHDRTGILFEISQTIADLGLDIHLAKIATHVDQALDVFYVTDRRGNKIVDPKELDKIELTLHRTLERKPAEPKGLSGRISR